MISYDVNLTDTQGQQFVHTLLDRLEQDAEGVPGQGAGRFAYGVQCGVKDDVDSRLRYPVGWCVQQLVQVVEGHVVEVSLQPLPPGFFSSQVAAALDGNLPVVTIGHPATVATRQDSSHADGGHGGYGCQPSGELTLVASFIVF